VAKAAKQPEITARDLEREIEAAKNLMTDIRAMVGAEDEDCVRDTFEGETTLDDAIRRTLLANFEDEIQVTGIKALVESLTERRRRIEKRIDTREGLIEQAMIVAEWPKKQFDIATLSIGRNPAKLEIDDESAIPVEFWRRADPTLDKAALKDRAKEHHAALTEALAIDDPTARASALLTLVSQWPPAPDRNAAIFEAGQINDPNTLAVVLQHIAQQFPPIPGCHIEDGGRSLKVRRK